MITDIPLKKERNVALLGWPFCFCFFFSDKQTYVHVVTIITSIFTDSSSLHGRPFGIMYPF